MSKQVDMGKSKSSSPKMGNDNIQINTDSDDLGDTSSASRVVIA